MEIRDIIIIIMFIQLVIVSIMCVRNAEKQIELLKLIDMIQNKR